MYISLHHLIISLDILQQEIQEHFYWRVSYKMDVLYGWAGCQSSSRNSRPGVGPAPITITQITTSGRGQQEDARHCTC